MDSTASSIGLLTRIKQEALKVEHEKNKCIQEDNERREEEYNKRIRQEFVKCITNEKNWSYNTDGDVYRLLISEPCVFDLSFHEIESMLMTHLNATKASSIEYGEEWECMYFKFKE